jgi:hypothetical protein
MTASGHISFEKMAEGPGLFKDFQRRNSGKRLLFRLRLGEAEGALALLPLATLAKQIDPLEPLQNVALLGDLARGLKT